MKQKSPDVLASNDEEETNLALALKFINNDHLLRQKIEKWLVNHGGTTAQAEVIMQEALSIMERNLREGKFKEKSTLKGYYFGMVRYFWLERCRSSASKNEGFPSNEEPPIEYIE